MTEPQIPTKAQLLEALRSSAREVTTKLEGVAAPTLEEGRYESGWNARQILAHVASIEWTYPRLIDLGKEATPPAPDESPPQVRRTEAGEAAGPPTRQVRGGGIDSYNQRQVEKRADASVPDLLAEFKKNRAATIAAVEGADEALLVRPIRSAGGITGALASVIEAVAVQHVRTHLRDILGESNGGQRQ